MRVISGYLKGRNILGYNTPGTRPTMDRVKESMFASIQDYIDNSTILDLFCGTGSLGIESLSMGSNKCYFVDNGKEILKYLNKNIDNLNIKDKSIVINKDYKVALENFKKSNIYFDIIYIDPPYKLDMAVKSIDYILNNNLLSKDGVIIIETDEEERELEELKNIDVNIYNVKRYGRVKLIFLRRKE